MGDPPPLVVLGDRTGGRPALFCMHPIGGHVNAYTCLRTLLDREQPIYAVRSRAVHAAEAEHATLAAMAADYATVVQSAHRGPYRLFGWSMGALTAHAVACELERRGEVVDFVGMVDPQVGVVRPGPDDLRSAVSMAIQIFHPFPPSGSLLRGELRKLELREVDRTITGWCVARGLLPETGTPEDQFEAAIRLFAIHRELVSAYQPAVCRAPLVIWKARELGPRAHDWAAHTTGTCAIKALAADHFAIMRSPHIESIGADLDGLG